jgi:hypothetical protein
MVKRQLAISSYSDMHEYSSEHDIKSDLSVGFDRLRARGLMTSGMSQASFSAQRAAAA